MNKKLKEILKTCYLCSGKIVFHEDTMSMKHFRHNLYLCEKCHTIWSEIEWKHIIEARKQAFAAGQEQKCKYPQPCESKTGCECWVTGREKGRQEVFDELEKRYKFPLLNIQPKEYALIREKFGVK